MWWISRNGVLSGPFPRDQIEKRIKLGLIVSLDRVSEDKRNWTYIRDTEFWHQERTIPELVAMPPPSIGAKIHINPRRPPAVAAAPLASAPPVADIGSSVLSKPSEAPPSASPIATLNADREESSKIQSEDLVENLKVSPNIGLPTSEFSIWKLIFGGVFHRHNDAAISSILNGDGHRSLAEGFFPKTWLWSRAWLWATILTIITLIMAFNNARILPGFFMLAAFGVPVSMVLLFLECDVTRRVSIWKTAGVFIAGGVFSLLATTILGNTDVGATIYGTLDAGGAGPIEETAKLLILIPFLGNTRKYPSVLNGLLLGAAVGAGFAAFETAGYLFNDAFMASLVNGASWEDALGVSTGLAINRAIFAPFCHIAWTASIGGALWKARGESVGIGSALSKKTTWGVILLAMFLHLLWNWTNGGISLIGIAPWVIIIHYLAHGYGKPTAASPNFQ